MRPPACMRFTAAWGGEKYGAHVDRQGAIQILETAVVDEEKMAVLMIKNWTAHSIFKWGR